MPDQGPSRSAPYYDNILGGTIHTQYDLGPAYDTAPHAPMRPPTGPRPPTESVQIYSVRSTDYPLGFVRQQSPRQMDLAWPSSQGTAGAWNLFAGSYSHSHQSTSESHSSYHPGGFRVVRQQSPRPITSAPPSQGHTRIQNTWVPISRFYLDFTFLRPPLPEENWTTMGVKKRKALVVCDG